MPVPAVQERRGREEEAQRLVRACLQGDQRAWEALVRRYARLIHNVARDCGLNQDDASDVFQTVCLRLLQNLEQLRDERALSGWLITVARREAWHLLKLRRRDELRLEPAGEEREGALELLAADELLPEELVLRLEEEQQVRSALGELGGACRELLELLYHTEPPLSYAEVARKVSIPVGGVGPTRARCLQKMKRILERMQF